MDIVIRDGYPYKIIKETDTDVCVEAPFEFSSVNNPVVEVTLELWWDKDKCIIFRDLGGVS